MIQFNHPCNTRLRHIGGRLHGERRVWTGLPLGRLDAWTVETQMQPPSFTHICMLSHTRQHTALLSGLCQARGHCRISQSCRGSLGGWSDVFVLSSSRSPDDVWS